MSFVWQLACNEVLCTTSNETVQTVHLRMHLHPDVQTLTALHLEDAVGIPSDADHRTLGFLTTLCELRLLTFEALCGVSGDVVAGVLQMPKLQHLHFISMQDWEWSAATIGVLGAKAAAQRPGLRITFD